MQYPQEPQPPYRLEGGLDSHRLANIVKADYKNHPERYGNAPISVIRVFMGSAVVIPDVLAKKDSEAWYGAVTDVHKGLCRILAGHTVILAGPAIEAISDVPLPCLDMFYRDQIGPKTSGVVSTLDRVQYDGWLSAEAPIQESSRTIFRRKAGYRLKTQRPWHELPVLQKHFIAKAAKHPDGRFSRLALQWTPSKPHGFDINALLGALHARFKDDSETWFVTTFSE